MNREILLGNKMVGDNYPPYFIADIAANHDGDLNRAYKLIELAKESGADAAKFQNFKAATIVSDKGFKSMGAQLSHQSSWKKSVYEVYEDASLDDDWTPLLKEKCNEVGIEYITSPYDMHSVDWANPYVDYFKIGSGDITWTEILEHIALKSKPVCLATGAASLEEVERAVNTIEQANENLILMQCNTNYTASTENFKYINLNVLKTYKALFPDVVLGLSDHTKGHVAVLGAIALGARVIEKHFTDDNDREGPDHKFSTTPQEWREMVDDSNKLFAALGDGIKRIEENEKQTCLVQKRGVYVNKDIPEGHIFQLDDFIMLRPRSDAGFEPYEVETIVGKRCANAIEADSMLLRKDIQ